MLSNVMPLSIRVKSRSSFLFFWGGGVSENAEQHYVLFKELEPYLGLTLTSSRT